MKKLLLVTGAALALGAAGSSYAAIAAISGNTGTAPGLYVGVGAGYGGLHTSKLNADDEAAATTWGGKKEKMRGFAARGSLGYLWALPQVQNLQLGAELGYNYYPQNSYYIGADPTKYSWNYKSWSADLLAVGKYNFSDTGFNLIGKAGAAYIRQKTTVTVGTFPVGTMVDPEAGTYTKKAFKPEAVIGVGYDINKNIGINLTYAHVFGSKPKNPATTTVTPAAANSNVNDYTKIASVDTILLNVSYNFGNLGGLV